MTTSSKSPRDSQLISHAAASNVAGVSLATWHRLVAAGKTPLPIKLSRGLVRFRRTDMEKWIALGCPARDEWLRMSEEGRR